MKKRAVDQKNYMVGVNTWLFAMGALLVGYNAYIGLPAKAGDGHLIWGNFSQKDAVMVSSLAIMLAGFFYSVAILKPDILKRNRERQLMKLKVMATQHCDFIDDSTQLYNGEYFLQILKAYLDEFKSVDRTLGLIMVEIKSDKSRLEDDLQLVAAALDTVARDYDVISRLDENLIAILTPHIVKTEFTPILTRFQKAVSASKDLPEDCICSFGTAINSDETNTPAQMVESAAQSLHIAKRLNPFKLEA
ncbi:MAG: diguanylate cyclase [Pseudomonadota bacterium]